MRIALISDIHSNLYALQSVLESIKTHAANRIYCLGDIVGYHSFPNEVIELIKTNNIISIKGNHDKMISELEDDYPKDDIKKWTKNRLTKENLDYLNNLPEVLDLKLNSKKIKLVHGSPKSISEYMFENDSNTLEYIQNYDGDILACAHTHFPYVKKYKEKLLINTGSVGKPKIGKPLPTYIIINIGDTINAKIYYVEYDFENAANDMRQKGLSEKHAQELILGKTI